MIGKTNKAHIMFICIFVASLCCNICFIYSKFSDPPAVTVEGNLVLSKKELHERLSDNYKLPIVNSAVSDYLLGFEAEKRMLHAPSDEELTYLMEVFPLLVEYSTDLDKHHDRLKEIYYVYQIYQQDGIEKNEIQNFLEEYYDDRYANLFEIVTCETQNHSLANDVQSLLEAGVAVNEVEKSTGVNFTSFYITSMDSLLAEYDNSVEAVAQLSHSNNNCHVHSETITNKYEPGEVFHIMDEDGRMKVLMISDIFSIDDNFDHFKNLYFSKKYVSIKNNIINNLKGKYTISYY